MNTEQKQKKILFAGLIWPEAFHRVFGSNSFLSKGER